MTEFKRDVRLNSATSVARLLARVTNGLLKDEITESKARAVTYTCTVLLKALEVSDIESRLSKLEEKGA